MAKLDAERRSGERSRSMHRRRFPGRSKLSRRDWDEIRLWHRKARREYHHP
jgi:hypothetical protein